MQFQQGVDILRKYVNDIEGWDAANHLVFDHPPDLGQSDYIMYALMPETSHLIVFFCSKLAITLKTLTLYFMKSSSLNQ